MPIITQDPAQMPPTPASFHDEATPDSSPRALPQPTEPPTEPPPAELPLASAAVLAPAVSPRFFETLVGQALAIGGPGVVIFLLGLYLGSPAGAALLGHTTTQGVTQEQVRDMVATSTIKTSADLREMVREELQRERAEARREQDQALAPILRRLDEGERRQERILDALDEIKAQTRRR